MNKNTLDAVKKLYATAFYGVLLCDTQFNVLWANVFSLKNYPALLKDKQLTRHFIIPNRHMAIIALREKASFDATIKNPDNNYYPVHVTKIDEYNPCCLVFIYTSDQTPTKIIIKPSPDSEHILEAVCHSFMPHISGNFALMKNIKKSIKNKNSVDVKDIDLAFSNNYSMLRAIQNINEYKNLCQEDVDYNPVLMNVSIYLNSLLEEVQFKLKDVGIDFSYNLKPDEQVVSYVDQKMFTLAIINLIANARFYKSNLGTIKFKLRKKDGNYLISIQNRGPLVPRDILRKVFEPYYSYDLIENAPKGIGLGLTICRMIASVHDGECKFSSTSKYGNVSTLKFPIVSAGNINTLNQPRLSYCKDQYGYISTYLK